jgi:hypothetical protein
MSPMRFSSPEFFILLPALAMLGWFWRGLGLHRPLRALMLVGVVTALAGPSIRKQQDSLDLHVLLDRSDSTEDLVDRNLPEWRKLLEQSKPKRQDTLRWVNYGAEVADLGSDGATFTGSRKLTRTALALSSIAAQADDAKPARVLLFTDGFSTEPLAEAAEQLRAQGIPVDFRLIRDETQLDYRLTRLQVPPRAQVGEPFLISLLVRGSTDGEVPLVISRSGRKLTETTVQIRDGVGTVEFTDRLAQAGSYEYEAEIRPETDAHSGNNRAKCWIQITGGPRLILVSRYQDDPVAKVLGGMNFSVETIEPTQLKSGMLTGAKAVVFNNVPAHEIPNDFLKALDFFVREQGGGFLMAGGERSFGAGGYFESAIDELLPVSMELKSEHRKLAVALAIVMDRSGSMTVGVGGGQTKMDLANSGAARAIELLGPMDQIAVFAVDSQAEKVVPLGPIGNEKQKLINRTLRVKGGGGGIFVYEGLDAAWSELRKSKAGTRHVILFSDAQDSEEPGDYKDLIQEMTDEGCTITVIGLGTNGDADAALLEDIALLGNGRIFFSDRPMDIPQIFAQETVTIARSAFLKDPVSAKPTGRWNEISPKPLEWLGGVDGYNLSYAREDASVSLFSGDEYAAPLVAHARRGLGRTMAVSFPLGGEYSEATRNWPAYGDFLQTAGRFLMGEETPPGIALRHRVDGTRLTVDLLYDEETWTGILTSKPPLVRLHDEATGETTEPSWRRISPGHFTLSRDLEEGSVIRGAAQIADHALSFGPINIGSSAEWSFDPSRLAELRAASALTGGRELLDLTQAWLRPPRITDVSLLPPLVIALLCLLLADALITRTGWKIPALALPSPSSMAVPKPVKRPVAKAPFMPKQAEQSPAPGIEPVTDTERSSRFDRAKRRK